MELTEKVMLDIDVAEEYVEATIDAKRVAGSTDRFG